MLNQNTTTPLAVDPAALAQAIEALKSFDWGSDRKLLAPIDDAVIATAQDATARADLEKKLAALLGGQLSLAAKDVVCRTLTLIGSKASAPALAALLSNPEAAHMGRYALERIPAAEAATALRDALPALSGKLLVGAIGSVGARRDAAAVPALAKLLLSPDVAVGAAAACALGNVASEDAAKVLCEAGAKAPPAVKPALADAALVAAERLLAAGNRAAAKTTYLAVQGGDWPKPVRLAATRGLLRIANQNS